MTEQLFDNAPCGCFAFLDDGTVFKVNNTVATILQYQKEDIEGKKVDTIFTIATRIFLQTHFFPLVRVRGHAEELYLTLLTRDGQHLPILLNASRITWEERQMTCCAFIVVPTRKKFEDELIAARNAAETLLFRNTTLLETQAALQQQQEEVDVRAQEVNRRNHELKQFGHVITHNLKEPLRKILLFTDKLKGEMTSPTISKLVRSTDQMRAVVTGLQQYVWLNEKSNRFEKVDLNLVVRDAINELVAETQEIGFHVKYHQLANLDGDEEQLRLLFYHILSNARKFRKHEHVNVIITSKVLKQNSFRTVGDKYKYVDFVRVEIKDDGIGFDMKYRTHIFELFRKLDVTAGQGLGLALCKRVVENHGGSIEAESELNTYTKIIFWLPLNQAEVVEVNTQPGADGDSL
jgi:phosphoserine phosphatase RsbU/P